MSDGLPVQEARSLLRTADQARNADSWQGDRNADSQALATLAIGWALVGILEVILDLQKGGQE